MSMAQNDKVSILARCGKRVPNTDAGSGDDKRNALPLIQTIIRLRSIHAKALMERKRTGGPFCERDHQRWIGTPNEGHASVSRLQVDVPGAPIGDVARKRA